ncbi:DNA-directed DNA polymerase [Terrihabitans soli]|uniref:DNA polymerase III subunit alpha n=1 Tax=Terrihabitans soli TaxID=708113 RepID=A0A6S6QHT6_9HYPH|nr:DNA polymerase III subunit alpha [Terrihabitans soli]BCJ90763.1 DNA-directed DNA polymerase [Terrihabitans soli]
MSGVGFVHLHVHSAFSLLEGALPIKKLADLAKADKQPALALTDTSNLFGALEFSEKFAESGLQPIAGATIAVDFADREAAPGARPGAAQRPRLVLLARSEEGYTNLLALTSAGFLETDPADPYVSTERLTKNSAGLICLSGGPGGPLNLAIAEGRDDLAASRLARLKEIFGDRLYVELQRHGLESETFAERRLIALAYAQALPLVATNECYFATVADYEAHDALLAIAEGRLVSDSGRRQVTPEHRFKTRAEMMALFADLPEALQSTVEIAKRCAYRPRATKPILPRFTRDGDEAAELRRQARAGLDERLKVHGRAPGIGEEEYSARLDFEINVIEGMKFPGYFLIVADFIKWAKAQGIPVGPGRGSGAGSLVAWALTITDLDPIRFGLLFERFLNPDRVSMPDFDIDFCQDRRGEVINYVQQKYGQDHVAQIITFGTLQARGVMRDVGRVLEMPYGQVDKLCKLVPQNPANPVTLAQAIKDEPRFEAERETDPRVGRLLDIALKLEGLNRHASTHAAGIVIGNRPLAEFTPLYRDPRSDMPVTQFNMKWVEQAGLVKFDFLGLKTLTTIEKTVALLKDRDIDVDISTIPIDDAEAYALMARGETVGVFQVESAGMRRALLDMRPDRFEDIVALVALYRPGPMANIPTYCARKQGREQPDYPHPKIEDILKETYGVIIYQEQVMQIAQVLAGYSLGQADLLRRAMGKKIRKEMDAQRGVFVKGATEREVKKGEADAIFDLLQKFADYGFNKSHAAAYALVSYQTAYLKAKYPVEFMAASMTLDMGSTDKLAEFRTEAQRLGIEVQPPNVNTSGVEFGVHKGAIRYALAAVKGVGAQAAAAIVAARGEKPFADLGDFARRLDPKQVNKRTLESLAQAGAFDDLEKNRAAVVAAMEEVVAVAGRTQEDAARGQGGLFGNAAPEPIRARNVQPWLPGERLTREYEAIGFFLTGHPLDSYGPLLGRMKLQRWSEFSTAVRQGQTAGRLAATVLSRQEKRTKSGNRMGIIKLSDASGHYEAILFSEALAEYRDLLEPNTSIVVMLQASVDGEEVRARIISVQRLEEAAEKLSQSMQIFLRDPAPVEHIAKQLQKGEGDVSFVLMTEASTEVEVKLPGGFRVSPTIAAAIKAVPGVVDVVNG